ncbi:DUF721 domain-containing protein [Candidatus Poribacteria bacterium]|nr:DUF721 domain-containing protein [Candidatus Poribacteria bacterium]
MRHRKSGRTNTGKSPVKKRSTRMQSVVETVVREREWADKLYEMSVFDIWESVVGEAIAGQTAPVLLLDGVLRVDVAHQVYANELSLMKTNILSKMGEKLEGLNSLGRQSDPKNRVSDIRFRLNPQISNVKNSENGTTPETSQQQKVDDIQKDTKSISPELLERIETAVSVVNDNDLREALKTLFLTQCSDIELVE